MKKKIAERIRALRAESKLTGKVIAEKAGISVGAYAKIENGQRAPSDEMIGKFVGALMFGERKTKALAKELLTLKYLDDSSAFVREMAAHYQKTKLAA